ncbi:MAG: hypothetical protein U0793_04960 [Gemmataceae bacterium]
MKRPLALLFLSAAVLSAYFGGRAHAVPVPSLPAPLTVEQWEYCEIVEKRTTVREVPPAGKAGAIMTKSVSSLRWVTAETEIEAPSWADLGAKMKIPAKADASPEMQRLRVLNRMGMEGWELISHSKTGSTITGPENWLFRRKRVDGPK